MNLSMEYINIYINTWKYKNTENIEEYEKYLKTGEM